ncbi:hypothetical protein [Bdellovibrio sp. NC01]|uniref:hypothetical protein n=1 Tax=Bdellovibrio sp. NC01 TaxID=2220073 RepID=UPI0011594FD7|nr:hypothetical protein [Bdellovibrio sp. NC01]QDK37991.1 hypothetical protein DOE51_10525 [Bdellovibrio sp. NC01]
MLKLTASFLMLFLFSATSFAVDTSGCSPLSEKTLVLTTAQGKELTATLFQPQSSWCWNAGESKLRLIYKWTQVNSAQAGSATFWMRINEMEAILPAQTQCVHAEAIGYEKNTSGEQVYLCAAFAEIAAPATKVQLEVAPVVNGNWDTAGYEKNYLFNF